MPELEAEQTDIIAMLVEDVLQYVKSSTHEEVIMFEMIFTLNT